MIDTPTAWSILCDPMTYVVGVLGAGNAFAARRWWKCLRGWEIAADLAANRQLRVDQLHAEVRSERASANGYGEQCAKTAYELHICKAQRDESVARAVDLEDRLRKIEQSRHNAAKVGRAAQLAQQSAAKEARRLELEQNIADRAEPVRKAA